MTRSAIWMLLLPLALGACGGGQQEAEGGSEQTAGEPATTPAAVVQEPLPEGNVSGPGTGTATAPLGQAVKLAPVANSGISGELAFTEAGSGTQVMVRVAGAQGPGQMQGHVHKGSCEKLGEVVAPLEPITVDATGMGSSTSTVNLALGDLTNGEHVVSYHQVGGTPGPSVVCGVAQRAGG